MSRAENQPGRALPGQDQLDRMLDQWRRERPEIEADGMALVPRVMRLAHLYDGEMARVSRSFGLKPGWLDVLSALRRIGPPCRMSATQLARWVLLSSGGMTSRLDRMEAAGLLRRRPDPSDRRGVLVELTERGRRVIDAAIDAHLAVLRRPRFRGPHQGRAAKVRRAAAQADPRLRGRPGRRPDAAVGHSGQLLSLAGQGGAIRMRR